MEYKKLEQYCTSRSTIWARYLFWNRSQGEEETIDDWVKNLRSIALQCQFEEQDDNLIRDKLISGVKKS